MHDAFAENLETELAPRFELTAPVSGGRVYYASRPVEQPYVRMSDEVIDVGMGSATGFEWTFDGAATFAQLIARLRADATAYRDGARRGLELQFRVDDYAHIAVPE